MQDLSPSKQPPSSQPPSKLPQLSSLTSGLALWHAAAARDLASFMLKSSPCNQSIQCGSPCSACVFDVCIWQSVGPYKGERHNLDSSLLQPAPPFFVLLGFAIIIGKGQLYSIQQKTFCIYRLTLRLSREKACLMVKVECWRKVLQVQARVRDSRC